MRTLAIIMAFSIIAAGIAEGQTTQPTAMGSTNGGTVTGDANEQTHEIRPDDGQQASIWSLRDWSFSATANTYLVPDGRSYVQPTLTADRHWLHLEARYNYEDLDTGSVFAGYNFSAGNALTLEATPMVGAVFGHTNGVAPGYKITLSYERFELYTEGEYLFDVEDSAGSFFYTWSEFTYSPTDWLRTGVVIQRSKAYQSDLDLQRGFLVGLSYKQWDFTGYVFNVGWEKPTFVLSVGARF
jgi:hypothetical protein